MNIRTTLRSNGRYDYGALGLLAMLSACGGGGTDQSQPISMPVSSALSVDAGAAQAVTLPDSQMTLSGSVQGGTATWSQVSGPSAMAFAAPGAPSTKIAAMVPGTYVLRLTARDAAGATKSSDVEVRVNANPIVVGSRSTPLDHLQSFVRPAFKRGHTLLPLSVVSCAVAPEIRLELMRHWGFSGQFNGNSDLVNDALANEIRSNPGRYPVEVGYGNLYTILNNYDYQRTDLPQLPASTWIHDANGTIVLQGGRPIVSPAAPDSAMRQVGAFLGAQAARVETALNAPIALVTNAGEYGLWVPTENDPAVLWGQDPAVLAHYEQSGFDNWFDYFSANKARQEELIKDGIFEGLTRGRPKYSWYQESWGTERGRWAGWSWYTFRWEQYIRSDGTPRVSDYASPEMYYNFANSGWSGINDNTGIAWDGLTKALRDAGGAVQLGQRNFYPWVSQGWDGGDSGGISADDLFVGAMKAYYTAGAIGAVSGYFTCSGPEFEAMRLNGAAGAATPTQVRGMVNLGKVHALFSHLEEYLRNGDLLPGTDEHPYKSFAATTPAMELSVEGEVTQVAHRYGAIPVRTARVLARKIRGQDRWLVTAWANTGNDRDVRVTIDPRIGVLTLRARRAGSVYIVTLPGAAPDVQLVDPDGMNPTQTLF